MTLKYISFMKLIYGLSINKYKSNNNNKKKKQNIKKCNKMQTLRVVLSEYLNFVERLHHKLILYK